MESNVVNSIVGEGSHLRGDFNVSGLIRVDGDITGSLRSDGKVLIGRTGRLDGSIEAPVVVVGGVCRGEIRASRQLVLLSTSLVLARLSAASLVLEDGVIFDGEAHIGLPDPGVGGFRGHRDPTASASGRLVRSGSARR